MSFIEKKKRKILIPITAFSCHVSFNKEHSWAFVFHDIDIVEEYRPFIL